MAAPRGSAESPDPCGAGAPPPGSGEVGVESYPDQEADMWRNLIRIAPLAIAGYKWWQRRKQKTAVQDPSRPPYAAPGDQLP